MRIIKKVLCVFVIFALAVSFVPTTASATGLAVVGTSFNSAGMTSAEFAASAGPYAIGILAALAAAYGIKTFTQSETGQAVKDFFQGLIEKRAAAMRRSISVQMEALLGNATIDANGNINLGRLSFSEAKSTLLQDSIPADKPLSSVSLKGYSFGNSLNYVFYDRYGDEPTVFYIGSKSSPSNNMFFQYVVNNTTSIKCWVVPDAVGYPTYPLHKERLDTGVITTTSYVDTNMYFYIGSQKYYIIRWGTSPGIGNAPTNDMYALAGGTYTQDDLVIDYPADTLYGVDETLREQNVGLYDGLVLAPDLINSAVLSGATGQISASDYCGALVDYVSGYDTVIDGVTVTGLPEAGTVPRSIDEAPTSDTVIDEAPPSTMTGTEAAGLYAFSLDELFPFCIPFDFVKIIEKFNVEPEAPSFDWRFYIPGVIDYTLHIDLSAWNSVAAVFRNMVLVAFVIGLIILTREMFIRA